MRNVPTAVGLGGAPPAVTPLWVVVLGGRLGASSRRFVVSGYTGELILLCHPLLQPLAAYVPLLAVLRNAYNALLIVLWVELDNVQQQSDLEQPHGITRCGCHVIRRMSDHERSRMGICHKCAALSEAETWRLATT